MQLKCCYSVVPVLPRNKLPLNKFRSITKFKTYYWFVVKSKTKLYKIGKHSTWLRYGQFLHWLLLPKKKKNLSGLMSKARLCLPCPALFLTLRQSPGCLAGVLVSTRPVLAVTLAMFTKSVIPTGGLILWQLLDPENTMASSHKHAGSCFMQTCAHNHCPTETIENKEEKKAWQTSNYRKIGLKFGVIL